jgi:hypothetical protein
MRLVWTPLPHRRDESGRLHASVFVSPRLEHSSGPGTPTTLGDPEFERIRHWPEFLAGVELAVEIDGHKVPAAHEAVDRKWWELLFSDTTPVTSHELPDHSATIVHTFPVGPVLDHIDSVYTAIAESSPLDHPPLTGTGPSLTGLLGTLGRGIAANRDIEESYRSQLLEQSNGRAKRTLSASEGVAGLSYLESAFWKANRFYARPESRQPYLREPDPGLIPDPPQPPTPDFHVMLAYLADHPQLLRRLGLIIDLVFDDPGVNPSGVIRVVVDPPDPALHVRPRVRYHLEDERFQVPPRDDALFADASLRLEYDREIFRIYQVDVDGAALKLIDTARNLPNALKLPSQVTPDPGTGSVASLRGGGFTVALMDRAVELIDAIDGSTDLDPHLDAAATELQLEDVLRGYRVDVLDLEIGQWRSLHRRRSDFFFPGIPGQSGEEKLTDVADEAVVRAQAATAADRDVSSLADPNQPGSGDLYLHEALFGWDGWSLAAPRPGKIIVEPGEGDPDASGGATSVTTEKAGIGTDLPLQATSRPEAGSLPRLRYGHEYRLRARVVDLAGNSLPDLPDDLNDHISPVHLYLRYEPVASPALVRAHPDTEGESLELMVIRSDRDPATGTDTAPAGYGGLPHVVAALAGSEHDYKADSRRHVAPPKTSVQTAEMSGVLDAAFGPGGDPAAVFRLARKEEGTFFDPKVIDPATGMATIDVLAHIKVAGAPTDPADYRRGYVPPTGSHLYRTDAGLPLPYLPDPAAVGIALHGDGLHHTEPFPAGGEWWDLATFRIRLVDGPAIGIAPLAGGELTISLPPAERIRLRLSSQPDPRRIDQFAHFARLPDATRTALRSEAEAGRMWLLTPYRYVELVHATQHPLSPPVLNLKPHRTSGATFTGFTGTIGNHARSTGRLDVHARWADPLDSSIPGNPPVDGLDGREAPTEQRAVAFGWAIEPHEDDATVESSSRISRHEFGDTKHHLVTYRPVATSRFREFFHPDITADPANIQHAGDEVILSVPNSSRPAPPRIRYIIPTFGWDEQRTETGVRRTRKGGGLRIYLDRPWYSSGRGEQLAVVLPQPPSRVAPTDILAGSALPAEAVPGLFMREITAEAISDRSFARLVDRRVASAITQPLLAFLIDDLQASPYYTIWGRDPIWEGLNPKAAARMQDFPRRLESSRAGLTIPDAPLARVAVAAHQVEYDPDRELWYCDVEIDAGPAYFPFVRLGLARYQPESIPGAHLSPVVVADFVQLTADRTASLVVGDGQARVTVSGTGPSNILAHRVHPSPFGAGPTRPELSRRVTAVLQSHDPEIPGELGWTDAGPEITLSRQAAVRLARRGITSWSGAVDIGSAAPGAGSHRILIREYERFIRDYDPDIDPDHSLIAPGLPWDPAGERIVYADTMDL